MMDDRVQMLLGAASIFDKLLNQRADLASLVNRLANIVIDSASKGYVSSNDLDEANDAIEKVVGYLEPK